MRYRTLGKTGLRVSVLGFGASPLGDVFGVTEPDQGARAVRRAIDLGINFFDVAPYYGRTLAEERLGAALQGRRREVVLATKCGRYDYALFDFSAARVRQSAEESLRRLRTDYLDLFQAHDIEFGDARQIVEETIPAMKQLQREGKVRFVGVTGLQLRVLRRVAEQAGVDTVLSYCRYNLLVQDLDDILTPYARETGVGLISAAPLHMGVLTEHGPPEWHPAAQDVKAAGRRAAAVCRAHGVEIADAAVRFCLTHPQVATTLLGMATVEHVERNVRAAAARPLDDGLRQEIARAIGPAANLMWATGRPENVDFAGRT